MLTSEQLAAIERCELAQRTGTTARSERMAELSERVVLAIWDKYHMDERA